MSERTRQAVRRGSGLALALLGSFAVFGLSHALTASRAAATEAWIIEPLAAPIPPLAMAPAKERSDKALPDGLVAEATGGDIAAAWYEQPTSRYDHGVIGDAVEAGALVVETADGRRIAHRLSKEYVFEDRYPRLADLDGDGRLEVVAIRSSLRRGAAVAVYGLDGDKLAERAATAEIGRSHRWLNIAAIAPFAGGAGLQIAYVETPHIGGRLRLLRYQGGALTEIASLHGFSNHAIASRELELSAVAAFPQALRLALPSTDRRSLRIVAYRCGALEETANLSLPAAVGGPVRVGADERGLRIDVQLVNGARISARPASAPVDGPC